MTTNRLQIDVQSFWLANGSQSVDFFDTDKR